MIAISPASASPLRLLYPRERLSSPYFVRSVLLIRSLLTDAWTHCKQEICYSRYSLLTAATVASRRAKGADRTQRALDIIPIIDIITWKTGSLSRRTLRAMRKMSHRGQSSLFISRLDAASPPTAFPRHRLLPSFLSLIEQTLLFH